LHHLLQTPRRNSTSLCAVGEWLCQPINSPITFSFSPTTLKINDIPVKVVEVVTDAHLEIGALMSRLIPSAYSFTSFVNLRIGSALELIGYS